MGKFVWAMAMLWPSLVFAAVAQPAPGGQPAKPSYEIVRQRVDTAAQRDGSFLQSTQTRIRILDEQGLNALRKFSLSYTEGYQNIDVQNAATIKADGKRIPVSDANILRGEGQSTVQGYAGIRTITVVFPDLAVGDAIEATTLFSQTKPWFPGSLVLSMTYGDTVPVDDAEYSVTAPQDGMDLHIDTAGVDGGERITSGGMKSWLWHYHNSDAQTPETGAILRYRDMPHITFSTFDDYAAVARAYSKLIEGRAAVTPEIQTLADKITDGIHRRREQARALYDWVSANIAYVAIVLGAGGFTPNYASDVLHTRYGDCKDHVILLEALLKAKGIDSTPVLINAGLTSGYDLPQAAMPYAFNHMITYVPDMNQFLDSTARFAPFDTLPTSDAGRPVLAVDTGKVMRTPVTPVGMNDIRVDADVTVAGDGSADGESKIVARGEPAMDMRALVTTMSGSNEQRFFQAVLGPGGTGHFDTGNLKTNDATYTFAMHYHVDNYANLPGPGALPAALAYKPFNFTALIAGDFPPVRRHDYACTSLTAEYDATVTLPDTVTVSALPDDVDLSVPGLHLVSRHTKPHAHRVHEDTSLTLDHADGVCTAAYYNANRATLARMTAALRAQVLYK